MFLPYDASKILKIPLNYNLPEDNLIWIGNKRGVFTVKSAYHIASSLVDSNEVGECSSSNSKTLLWKRIWSQKVPQKLKIFAWRFCVSGLPTMFNLSHRGIHCSSFCPLCDMAIESTAHALFLCDHAKLTWTYWHNCPVDVLHSARDPVDIVLDIIDKGSPNDLELFFAVAWSIWWNRNQAIFDDSGTPPGQVWEMANRTLSEYKAACTLPVFSSPPAPSVWQAPPPGFYKVNVDGAAFDDDRPSGIGVVIRDCLGSFIAASSKVLQTAFSAETTEALALQEGVLFASVLGISHVLVESDALSVIQGIFGCDTSSEQGHIIQNIKDVSSSFTWCSFQHLKRSGNRATHDLARAASSSGVSRIWKDMCPSFVRHVILEDCGL